MQTKRLWRILASFSAVAASVLTTGTLTPTIARADSPTLKITEINWAGSLNNAQDEWIELQNVSGSNISFASTPYTIEAEIGGVMQTIASLGSGDGSLGAGDFLVIHTLNAADSTLRGIGGGAQYVQSSSLDLPNNPTAYQVKQDATVVDLIADPDGSGPLSTPFAGALLSSQGGVASMSKTTASADSSASSSWYTAQTVGTYFDNDVVQYGTPGSANVDISAPTGFALTPAKATSEDVRPTVTGMADADATEVVAVFNRVGYNLTPSAESYTGAVNPDGSFSITAGSPDLDAGRYEVSLYAEDADGNRSKKVNVYREYFITPVSSSVPAPSVPNVPSITSQLSLTVQGTAEAVGHVYESIEVTKNGVFYMSFVVTDGAFTAFLDLTPNSHNEFSFYAVDNFGRLSMPAEVAVHHDSIAPGGVNLANITVNANPAGTADSLQGQAGAAEPNSTLYVYTDAALTQLLATLPVNADGSFGQVNLGDNLYTKLYLVAQDAAGNRSAAVVVENSTGYLGSAVNSINPVLVSGNGTELSIRWTAVPNATSYRLKFKPVGGAYGSSIVLCDGGNANCSFTATITGLIPNTDYIVAMAAVDHLGNESQYIESGTVNSGAVGAATATAASSEFTGVGGNPIASQQGTSTGSVRGTDQVVTPTPSPTPTPAASATPESGEVKSATDDLTRNWTPWIILGVLLGIAILATAGYFYWFGGDAGETAMAGIAAERAAAARAEKEPAKSRTTGSTRGKPTAKKSPRAKRW